MRLLRAPERNNESTIQRCLHAYPELASYMPRDGNLEPLRQHAISLHRASILQELRSIHAPSSDEQTTGNRRCGVQTRLKKLKPGHYGAIGAVMGADGVLHSSPGAIAKELRRYWSEVFTSNPLDHDKFKQWIREGFPEGPPLDIDRSSLHIRAEDIDKITSRTSNSLPGPDGIPYIAWDVLGETGRRILLEAAQELHRRDTGPKLEGCGNDLPLDTSAFNLGSLVFIPKKIAGVDPMLGDLYCASDVCPLCIVNTDDRIIANAVRRRLEPF